MSRRSRKERHTMFSLPRISLALGAVAVMAMACGAPKAPEPAPQAKVDPAVAEIKGAMQNFAAAKSFRAQIAAQVAQPSGGVNTIQFLYTFVPPDRYELSSNPNSATRVVGGETFARTGDTWALLKEWSGDEYAGANRLFDQKTLNQWNENIGKTSTVEKTGTETVDGKQCQLYVLTDTPTGNKTDVCVAENLPLRMVYHFGQLNTTVLFRDFNTNIVLDRPKV
jgi:hypothetical protein